MIFLRMRKLLFLLAFPLLLFPLQARAATGWRLPILMFHHVQPLTKRLNPFDTWLSYSPKAFEWVARFIHDKSISALKMADLLTFAFDRPAAALTFDDGYEDFYTYAFPILKKYQLNATVFVITGKLDVPGYLTRVELLEMQASGLIEIGSHTVNHVDLTQVNPQKLEEELTVSKKTLEALTGAPVTSFCYPSGRVNKRVAAAVKKAGYMLARTTRHGFSVNFQSPFLIPTIRMQPSVNLKKVESWWGFKFAPAARQSPVSVPAGSSDGRPK